MFLDRKGVILFNGTNIQIISSKVDPVFARMNVNAAKTCSSITYDKERNQLLIDIPVDGSEICNITVVYDIISNAWTTYRGYQSAVTAIGQGQFTKDRTFYGGYSGLVSHFGPSFCDRDWETIS